MSIEVIDNVPHEDRRTIRDAEQVIVLEAESDRRGAVSNHGSIDNDDIVQTVVDLLEGGVEAFNARRRRYRDRASC
jgi:hypothetical protein